MSLQSVPEFKYIFVYFTTKLEWTIQWTPQILDSSKVKEFADDNLEFDENRRKFSIQLENIVENGEIARDEQFLFFFPECFQ